MYGVLLQGNQTAVVTYDGSLYTLSHLRAMPQRVEGLNPVVGVACSMSNFTVAVLEDGNVWASGNNADGQIGPVDVGRIIDEFLPIGSLRGVIAVATGGGHSVFLFADGTVATMGWNCEGQLGNGGTHNSAEPIRLDLQNVVSIGAGYTFSAAVTENGRVFTWGYGGFGRLGNGSNESQRQPRVIPGITDAVAVSCGDHHSAIVHRDGSLSTFGGSQQLCPELGQGDGIRMQFTPRRVRGIEGAVAVACGGFHTIVRHEDGRVSTFGNGVYGQLGLGGGIRGTSVPQVVHFE
jgi:hypothetical protein